MEKILELFEKFVEMNPEMNRVASCNADISAYLVRPGTEDQITYTGKPQASLRVSDHWSWYANVKKCHYTEVVQCPLRGITPYARNGEGLPSRPQFCKAIALYLDYEYLPLVVETMDGALMIFNHNMNVAIHHGIHIPPNLYHVPERTIKDISGDFNPCIAGDMGKFFNALINEGYDVVEIRTSHDKITEVEYINDDLEYRIEQFYWG